ncbi:type IV secretion system protein VirB5 [Sphingobium sp. SA2]|uniref:type IV secretion system protein n=1 Tax=Sphingobium sp. SA2 TaxID=1524832 RepID=UPI0028C32835|nr:type IV secretion system protein [Sphingobium sp. SA2]MDT7533162.1 type IV secretion system protein VirB5 [Sphingobium sp. SA2]
MKQLILAAVSIGSLMAATPASAQGIPTFDSTAVLKHVEQIQKTMQMIEQGRQQIAEAQKLYNDLNKLTDVSSIGNQLKTDTLRSLNVDVSSLEKMARGDFGGGGSYGGRSDAIYQDMLERLGVSGNGDQSDVRYQSARSIAMDKAMAEGMGEAATSRGEGLEELRGRLATASTAKEVADLQARIQLESASMMNDQLRIDAMERARRAEASAKTAESLSNYSRDREEQRARARAAAGI